MAEYPGEDNLEADFWRDDAQYPDMRAFEYKHLPPPIQTASKFFCVLAQNVNGNWPICKETGVALRKLLEAKDAAVRAVVFEGPPLSAVHDLANLAAMELDDAPDQAD
jgi:hypothetical protein